MSKNDQLLSRLREIGFGPGDLDVRVPAAEAAVRGERCRFPASDAGRIQWNWYMGKFATEIRFECDRLELVARKRTKPGDPASGRLLELFRSLQPRILSLRESMDEPIPLSVRAEARPGG
jgi:hypothetical protein